jgi:hypothetical protein
MASGLSDGHCLNVSVAHLVMLSKRGVWDYKNRRDNNESVNALNRIITTILDDLAAITVDNHLGFGHLHSVHYISFLSRALATLREDYCPRFSDMDHPKNSLETKGDAIFLDLIASTIDRGTHRYQLSERLAVVNDNNCRPNPCIRSIINSPTSDRSAKF